MKPPVIAKFNEESDKETQKLMAVGRMLDAMEPNLDKMQEGIDKGLYPKQPTLVFAALSKSIQHLIDTLEDVRTNISDSKAKYYTIEEINKILNKMISIVQSLKAVRTTRN